MPRDAVMRAALWATTLFNFGAALMFVFPASLGRLGGLPVPDSPVYALFAGMLIALLGAVYAWLAQAPRIPRPLVAILAVGKASAFALALGCWLAQLLPLRGVLLAVGDLVFAAIFAWWLLAGAAPEPPLRSPAGTSPG